MPLSIDNWKFVEVVSNKIKEILPQALNIPKIQEDCGVELIEDQRFVEFLNVKKGFIHLKCFTAIPHIQLNAFNQIQRKGNPLYESIKARLGTELSEDMFYIPAINFPQWFISANSGGYYSEVRDVLAGMLSFALKGNPSIEKALLTGIQRVAKENIFSGLNNLVVCTAADADYADCFGFTEEETRELMEYCGGQFTDEVRDMYDGYRIGDCELYNPWSVSCYCARKRPESYWVNTGENSILKNALAQQRSTFAEKYNTLVEEGKITVKAELSTAYYEKPNDASLWGLLINAGMVTIEERKSEEDFTVRVPNQEVWKAFQELTAFYLQVDEYEIGTMLGYLKTGDIDKFAEAYRKVLLELPSYHDLKDENSYHMMMLGMCTFLRRDYDVRSNRESGSGRGDILLYAKKPSIPNLVLEFKYTKDHSKDLEELATDAVRQIKEKNDCADMQGETVIIGLAHCGKQAAVAWEK